MDDLPDLEDMAEIARRLPFKNRANLCAYLKTQGITKGTIVLEGGTQAKKYDTDVEIPFNQESNFRYLFGVIEPGFKGTIDLESGSGNATLIVPKRDDSYAVWHGEIPTLDYYKETYLVSVRDDQEEITAVKQPVFTIQSPEIKEALAACRLIKCDDEVKLMQYAVSITKAAHAQVECECVPGMKESQLDGIFQAYLRRHMCYFTSYPSICATGKSGAILHYNYLTHDRTVGPHDMILLDMGAEFYGYAADITRSFPSRKPMSDDQQHIWTAVKEAQSLGISKIEPGISWSKICDAVKTSLTASLQKLGLLGLLRSNENNSDVIDMFMPHSLGHHLGLDVHDGHKNPDILKTGMVLTVEPGLYFIDVKMKELEHEPYKSIVNFDVLDRFRTFGGVRIEDNVLVTENGHRVL